MLPPKPGKKKKEPKKNKKKTKNKLTVGRGHRRRFASVRRRFTDPDAGDVDRYSRKRRKEPLPSIDGCFAVESRSAVNRVKIGASSETEPPKRNRLPPPPTTTTTTATTQATKKESRNARSSVNERPKKTQIWRKPNLEKCNRRSRVLFALRIITETEADQQTNKQTNKQTKRNNGKFGESETEETLKIVVSFCSIPVYLRDRKKTRNIWLKLNSPGRRLSRGKTRAKLRPITKHDRPSDTRFRGRPKLKKKISNEKTRFTAGTTKKRTRGCFSGRD